MISTLDHRTGNIIYGYQEYQLGNLRFLYGQGSIRQVEWKGEEVLNHLYVAVRDRNWGTVSPRIYNENILPTHDGLQITFHLEYIQEEINYSGHLNVQINEQGSLKASFEGKALSSFLKNRIGLNVQLPAKPYAARSYEVTHSDQTKTSGQLPNQVSAHQPIFDIQQIHWGGHTPVQMKFTGEVFEMEDQRNWSDASFKIYSTPLATPFPVMVNAEDTCEHTFALKVSEYKDTTAAAMYGLEAPKKELRLPKIGTMIGRNEETLVSQGIMAKKLGLDHVLIEVFLSKANWEDELSASLHQLEDSPEVNICLSCIIAQHKSAEKLAQLAKCLTRRSISPSAICLFEENALVSKENLKDYFDFLKMKFPYCSIGSGTYAYYAEFNRANQLYAQNDFSIFSLSPQVHATDELSLIENLRTQSDLIANAEERFNLPVHLGPITLKQRMNFVATNDNDRFTRQVDARQHSVFSAIWTLSSIRNLMNTNCVAATYYELTGENGISKDADNLITPVFLVFKELLKLKSHRFFPLNKPEDYDVDGFEVHNLQGHQILWLWSFKQFDVQAITSRISKIEELNFRSAHWIVKPYGNRIPPCTVVRVTLSQKP